MTTQYTPILALALPVTGELSGTWGDVVNDNITSMVEQAIAGLATINTWAGNGHTLTTANGTTSESRCAMLVLTDTGVALTGAATVICPTASKIYIVKNTSGQSATITTAAGTGVSIPNGETMFVFCDGTNVVQAVTRIASADVDFAKLKGTGAVVVTNILDEDNMASDSATALATQQSIKAYVDSQISANNDLSEILANGNTTGGTDIVVSTGDSVQVTDLTASVAVFTDASKNLVSNAITGTGNVVMSTSPTLVTPALGTPSALVGTNITGTAAGLTAGNVTTNANLTGAVTSVGNATSLGSFTSAQLATALTDETGTGANVFATSPTLVTPALGTPSSGVVTNLTGTASININGTVGATTAAAGAFTTLSASGTSTLAAVNSGALAVTGAISSTTGANFATSSGNMGIGTSSPAVKLEVNIGSSAAWFTRVAGDIGTTNAAIGLLTTAATGQIRAYGDMLLYTTTVGGSITERLRINSAGNVGIGTSSPSSLLSINSATNGAYAQRIGVNDPGTGDVSSVKIGFDVKAIGLNPEPAAYIGVEEASTSSVQGSLTFATRRTNNNTVAPIEAMRIDSSGNLLVGATSSAGIGVVRSQIGSTSSTATQLLVQGTSTHLGIYAAAAAEMYMSYAVGSALIFGNGPANGSTFTERARIDSSGNVGIGTSSPGNKLHLSNAASNTYIQMNANTHNGYIGQQTDGEMRLVTGAGGSFMTFQTAGTERARIDSSGNLLVGTTTVGDMAGDGVIRVGSRAGIISQSNNSVANNGTVDIAVTTDGGGYQGFLLVSNTLVSNASIRTQRTYSVFGRSTDSSIQQIATDNGPTAGAAFTVTTPSNGLIRVTNTSEATCSVSMQFFGGTSL